MSGMSSRARPLLGVLVSLTSGACGETVPASTPARAAAVQQVAWGPALEAQARSALTHGKLEEAERAAGEAGRAYLQRHGPRHPDTGRAAELLAEVKVALHKHDDAEQALLFALSVREAEGGPSALRVAELLDTLSDVVESRASEREVAYRARAVSIRKVVRGLEHPEVATSLLALAKAQRRACRFGEAESSAREALAMRERLEGPRGAGVADALEQLADIRAAVDADDDAEKLLAQAAAILATQEATSAEQLVRVLGALASKERYRKDLAAAQAHDEQALAVAERHLAKQPASLAAAADGLATTLRARGQEAEAQALFRRLALIERVIPPGTAITEMPRVERLPPAQRCSTNGQVANAGRVVASLGPGFRRCYNATLREDVNAAGSVRLMARIGAQGEVLHVRTLTPASYVASMVTCPMAHLLTARFEPPQGGGATIVVPVTFTSR